MKALLTVTLVYFDWDDTKIVLEPGTSVNVDLDDGTACFDSNYFEIEPNEYNLIVNNDITIAKRMSLP